MGGGIAMNFANAGIPVTIVETAQDALDRGLATIRKNYASIGLARRADPGGGRPPRRRSSPARPTSTALEDADFIIEAVFEEMDLKKQHLRRPRPDRKARRDPRHQHLDARRRTRSPPSTKRPQDVLGTHFFSPANVMRLLEIVRGEKTAPRRARDRDRGRAQDRQGAGRGRGLLRLRRQPHAAPAHASEAERLILEGALPQDVDAALTEFGFPMGPFAMGDLAGIDVGWRIRKGRGERAEISDTLAEMGRFGQKTGAGYFRYEGGARTPIPDPEVEKIIIDASNRLGIQRRTIDKKEILERLVFPMINEGARILEEGIAYRPGDVDVVWVYGYGWPVWRGGPMFYADQIGLAYLRDRLAAYAARSDNKALEPAPLLTRLARDGRGFAAKASEDKAA